MDMSACHSSLAGPRQTRFATPHAATRYPPAAPRRPGPRARRLRRLRLSLRRCRALAWLLVLVATGLQAASPRPFEARYRLEVTNWPSAVVEHRLSHDGTHWQSDMRAAISLARGHERSRFTADDDVRATFYTSGYRLFGIGETYTLGREALTRLPDRQTALFNLSRRATQEGCESPCSLHYLDHRGREEQLAYRRLEARTLDLPVGRIDAVRVEVTDPDAAQRRLTFSFHPEVPGLLLAMTYHRDGQQRSHLTLTGLQLDPP